MRILHKFKPEITVDSCGISITQGVCTPGMYTTENLFVCNAKDAKRVYRATRTTDPEKILHHILRMQQ